MPRPLLNRMTNKNQPLFGCAIIAVVLGFGHLQGIASAGTYLEWDRNSEYDMAAVS